MSSLSTLPKGDSAWLLRKAVQRIMQQVSVLETNIGSSTTGNSANTQVIFNDNGTLRGDAGLTYNAATDTLSAGSATITGDLTVRTNKLKVDASGVGIGTTATTTGGGICCIQHASNNGLVIDATAGNPTLYLRNTVDTTPAKIMFTDNTGLLIANVSSTLAAFSASGNLGIGVTPSAWSSIYKVSQIGQSASVSGGTSVELAVFGSNCYFDATDSQWERITPGFTSQYYQTNSTHVWRIGGTAGANTDCAFTQAMTLDASGNLLVGTTTSLQNTSHSFKALGTTNSFWASTFQHDGTVGSPRLLGWRLPNSSDSNAYFVYAINSGGNCFNVFGNGSVNNSTGTYGTISDLRLKENISDARNYLADLLKLRVVKYSLKSEQSAVATKIGFVAQEVEQVFPTLVETNGDDVKSIKTSILIPMLLKAIQELTARVQTLEAK